MADITSETITVTVWHAHCSLCARDVTAFGTLSTTADERERIHRSSRTEAGALRELAIHRRENHIAPWVSDTPKCEGCGKSGPIEIEVTNRVTDHYDRRLEDTKHGRVLVDRSVYRDLTERHTQRLERDETVPSDLPDQWWHVNCRLLYHRDGAFRDAIDNEYDRRITDERKWTEELRTLIDQTEQEGMLWNLSWKQAAGRR